jgi:hypothetical protein
MHTLDVGSCWLSRMLGEQSSFVFWFPFVLHKCLYESQDTLPATSKASSHNRCCGSRNTALPGRDDVSHVLRLPKRIGFVNTLWVKDKETFCGYRFFL